MKTAILFSGQARSLQYTYLNLKEYLIDQIPNCDVFIYVNEDESSYQNYDCLEYLNPVKMVIKKDEYIKDDMKHDQRGGLQSYLQMLNSWKQSNNLRLQHEKENGFVYDRVIRTRLDIKFFDYVNINDNLDLKSYIYTSDFHNWNCVQGKGYHDRFAIGNSQNITLYCSMIDYVKQYSNEKHVLHAESTLYYHLNWQNIKVKQIPVRFTRVREFGNEIDNHLRMDKNLWPENQK